MKITSIRPILSSTREDRTGFLLDAKSLASNAIVSAWIFDIPCKQTGHALKILEAKRPWIHKHIKRVKRAANAESMIISQDEEKSTSSPTIGVVLIVSSLVYDLVAERGDDDDDEDVEDDGDDNDDNDDNDDDDATKRQTVTEEIALLLNQKDLVLDERKIPSKKALKMAASSKRKETPSTNAREPSSAEQIKFTPLNVRTLRLPLVPPRNVREQQEWLPIWPVMYREPEDERERRKTWSEQEIQQVSRYMAIALQQEERGRSQGKVSLRSGWTL